MKKFFNKHKYLIIIASFVLISYTIFSFSINKNSNNHIFTNIISFITSPMQKYVYKISYNTRTLFTKIFNEDELTLENNKLRSEVNNLKTQLIDFNKYKTQNQELLKLLNIKDSCTALNLTSGMVIGKILNDPYKSFIIDKGSQDNIKHRDCVITCDGLVGYVDKINATSSVVKTILNKDIAIGIYNINNGETGILSGNYKLAKKNMAKIRYLPNQSQTQRGDVIITSGSGDNFPKGIVIGQISQLKQELYNTSYFGVVQPACNLDNLKHVFIITSFYNQERAITPILGQSSKINLNN